MVSTRRSWLALLLWFTSSTWGWVASHDGKDGGTFLKRNNSRPSFLSSKSNNNNEHHQYECSAEVVGAFGRMGSFWLCNAQDDNSYAAAVPRGLSPGYLSPDNCPILVSTPSSSWESIWQFTRDQRRQDLVWIGNGIPPTKFQDCTVVVPHYSILETCRKSSKQPIGTNELSPSTFVFGKHAEYVCRILSRFGVKTEIVDSFQTIQVKAALKLFWASCMWLICHSSSTPFTFEEVVNQHQDKLDRLVDDMMPALKKHLGQSIPRAQVDDYMKSYSLSIPKAIPSKELAISELQDRNGLWLQLRTEDHPQLFHQELIESIVGKEKLQELLSKENDEASVAKVEKIVSLEEIGLQLSGNSSSDMDGQIQRIVIVGAGILGSSAAYFLKLQNPNADIQVIDLLGSTDLGKTTPASWAWLNANGKEPKEYQILNQLGLHAWKNCKAISHLPSWSGSLVRFERPPKFVDQGGYPCQGPISIERVLELEPFANWQLSSGSDQGSTYYFLGEGFVDPAQAVQTFREEAQRFGVTFVSNRNVTAIVRNDAGKVCGVECTDVSDDTVTSFHEADLVVVAAGIGAAAKALGNLPLKYEPGTIVHAKTTAADSSKSPRLSRILVDTMRSSHVLQRLDGSIVAGGGALAVGGAAGMVQGSFVQNEESLSMFEAAKQLSPTVVGNSEPMHFAEAVRPMPKDGLPAVGFLQQGLYLAVTHSGMTLGPLLTGMAAAEITNKASFHLLEPFRPNRLFAKESEKEEKP